MGADDSNISDARSSLAFPTSASECPECPAAAILAAQDCVAVTCPGCRCIYTAEPTQSPARRPSAPPPPPSLRSVVAELLTWDHARNGAAYAQRSSMAGVVEVLRSGIVGDGCSSTKGTWRPGTSPPERVVRASPLTSARYAALSPELRAVADAIVDDGGGMSLRSLTIIEAASEGHRGLAIELGIEARIGWRLADEKQREKWRGKVIRRDRAPALAGMEQCGRDALARLVAAWGVRVAA